MNMLLELRHEFLLNERAAPGGGGGVLKEFLGGDVPLGPWNP